MDDIKKEKYSPNRILYEKQMKMLKSMFEKNEISKEQYNTSAGGLVRKMNHGKKLSEMSNEELWFLFPISLREYNPEWKNWYQKENLILKRVLQTPEIIRIAHIGSTAVGSIMAKNIIDILVETINQADWEKIKKILSENGYRVMCEDEKRISFNKGYTEKGFDERVFHLHLRRQGDNDVLYFRDYLIENFDTAKEYETLKITLSKEFRYDRDAYTEAKTEFIKDVTEKAKKFYKGKY